ncbi:MAG: trypsin-like serine peptidase [Bdellovibrionota bacterium]
MFLSLLLTLVLIRPSWAVLHGTLVPADQFSAVKKLSFKGGNGTCTGTFIGPRTMVTAAHCIEAATSKKGFEASVDGVRASGYQIPSPYWNKKVAGFWAYDIAVVQFPPSANFPVMKLAKVRGKEGDPVIVIGYGMERDEVGRLRQGPNRIINADPEMGQYLLRNDRDDPNFASATPADSGGPLLNAQGEVLGTAVSSEVRLERVQKINQIYIDTQAPEIRDFLIYAYKELNGATDANMLSQLNEIFNLVTPPAKVPCPVAP